MLSVKLPKVRKRLTSSLHDMYRQTYARGALTHAVPCIVWDMDCSLLVPDWLSWDDGEDRIVSPSRGTKEAWPLRVWKSLLCLYIPVPLPIGLSYSICVHIRPCTILWVCSTYTQVYTFTLEPITHVCLLYEACSVIYIRLLCTRGVTCGTERMKG